MYIIVRARLARTHHGRWRRRLHCEVPQSLTQSLSQSLPQSLPESLPQSLRQFLTRIVENESPRTDLLATPVWRPEIQIGSLVINAIICMEIGAGDREFAKIRVPSSNASAQFFAYDF